MTTLKNDTEFSDKVIALANHLSIEPEDVIETSYGFEADGAEYNVFDEDEAEQAWEESLDNYLDECVYPELPDNMANYFDNEKWKRDARMDGRGHSLSSYDGNEEEESVEGVTYYIYRTN